MHLTRSGPDVLGSADKTITDSDGTTLAFEGKPEGVQERIDYLRDLLDSEDHQILTKHIEKRLAVLSGGVAIINVGGETEVEQKERIDRVDDAVHAVKAAKKEGILPGGGASLEYISRNHQGTINQSTLIGWQILMESIRSPFITILDNAGISHENVKLDKWGQGVDVIDGEVKDMIEAGIVDPVMVTKSALKNAVSVATTILSTDAVISNVRER